MKLVRYGELGQEKPGILDTNNQIRDLSSQIEDINDVLLSDISVLNNIDINALPIIDNNVRIAPCVSGTGKFVCIGLNYTDHAAETGATPPAEPMIFMKATSAICGAYDDVIIPRTSVKTDWEVELGIIIGKPAKYVSEQEALDYVAGYCVINDVSERDFQQKREGQFTKGKSCDTFGPIGPYLVTKDEVKDPQNLNLWLDVNGNRYQDGSTSKMIYGVAHLVSYISQFMTLHPCDIISTGTPAGVGAGMKPQKFLKDGDIVHLGIEGLGEQKAKFVADK